MIIYGHRGAAGECPENTIASCRHALARGVKKIEIDLQFAADDEIVIIHDTNVRRTTGARGLVNRLTSTELKKLDARASGPTWPNKRETGVPTLKALLKALPELTAIQLEIKATNRHDNHGILESLGEIFPNGRAAKGMTITCSSTRVLEAARNIVPWINRGYVSTIPDPRPVLDEYECSMLATHWSHCNPWLARSMRRRDVHLSVWTVNDPATIKNLYRMKVDSVITDYPSMAVPLLSSLTR